MKNKVILATLILIAFLSFVFYHFLKEDNVSEIKKLDNQINEPKVITEEEIILFYGINCPACIMLDQLIENNGINKKVSYVHKEVYYNQENTNQLIAKAGECGLNTNSISIPFLWADGFCYVGVEPIINYLKEKIHD
ncbi:MAG: hypothetical protein WC446_01310 [Candidatus Paceibacterota bacterium]|jgi:hypothetical protein